MGLLVSALFIAEAIAEETNDYYNQRVSEKSKNEVNRLINDHVKKFLTIINTQKKKDCDRKRILKGFLDVFDHNFTSIGNTLRADGWDVTESSSGVPLPIFMANKRRYGVELAGGREYYRRTVPLKGNFDDRTLYSKMNIRGCCVTTVNLNGTVIGIDKIDHFFGNGGLLFDETLDNPKLTDFELLKMNAAQENGSWGLVGSGVKSYGDLNANWSGIHFYRNVLDGEKPLLSCKDGVVTQNHEVHIEDYIHEGWNESNNCSAFPDKQTAQQFSKNLQKKGLKCPMSDKSCEKIIEHYPNLVERSVLVSPVCLKGLPISESVEQSKKLVWNDLKNVLGGIRYQDVNKVLLDYADKAEKAKKGKGTQ